MLIAGVYVYEALCYLGLFWLAHMTGNQSAFAMAIVSCAFAWFAQNAAANGLVRANIVAVVFAVLVGAGSLVAVGIQ